MKHERQAILAMVAAGRISPAQAERLLWATTGALDTFWIAAVCLVACVSQLHLQSSSGAFGHPLDGLVRHAFDVMQTAGLLLRKGWGGTI